jgi:hypothetical protein
MKLIQITLLTFLFTFIGCAIGPTHGILFTSTKFAGEFNANNDVKVTKSGEGCMHHILSLITFGNTGAGQVAKDNSIERIATVDHSTLSILSFSYYSLYRNYCTIVSGEGK